MINEERTSRISKLKPSVDKRWLYLIAGGIWSVVGLMLCRLAYGWLRPVNWPMAVILALFGLLLAAAIYLFGFSYFARVNIRRIANYRIEKICIFAFQRWTSYPLVVVMISLGIFLRIYSPIPKPYLAVLYIGIGGGLFLASLLYYRRFFAHI
jgi:hypothetical protein